jgi:hypothetical protein
MKSIIEPGCVLSRRYFLESVAILSLTLASASTHAEGIIKLPLPGGPDDREVTTRFPQKGELILQRTRPPLLETPFDVFDKSIFTPNDQFFVRWHWAGIPTEATLGKKLELPRGSFG